MWEGEEGKSLYGGASEKATKRAGFNPWRPVLIIGHGGVIAPPLRCGTNAESSRRSLYRLNWTRLQPSDSARSACLFLPFPWFLALGAPTTTPPQPLSHRKFFSPSCSGSIGSPLRGGFWTEILGINADWVADGLAVGLVCNRTPRQAAVAICPLQAAVARPSGARPIHCGHSCEVNDHPSKRCWYLLCSWYSLSWPS